MNRREFLAASVMALGASPALAAPATRSSTTNAATTKAAEIPDDLVWHDVREWGVEGRAFEDTESSFDRLPARAKGVVRPDVWNLSRNSTGLSAHFEAATDAIYVRYELTSATIAMAHMPASGVSGVDLYAKLDERWRWIATTQPHEVKVVDRMIHGMSPQRRAYHINLPLYNGVKSFEIGVPQGAAFEPIPPRKRKPILFYGTSITQGACASRPGMAFVSILGRKLNRPMLNFGFSGNGRMEVEVARFLAELDPAIFVLDCLANMGAVPIIERTEAVVKLLRERHSDTPILILEARPWLDAIVLPRRAQNHAEHCRHLRAAYDNLLAAGVKNLHYRKGDDLIGADGEATVDGSHPTDLGMMRYADALEPDLRKLLG